MSRTITFPCNIYKEALTSTTDFKNAVVDQLDLNNPDCAPEELLTQQEWTETLFLVRDKLARFETVSLKTDFNGDLIYVPGKRKSLFNNGSTVDFDIVSKAVAENIKTQNARQRAYRQELRRQ